VDAAERIVIKKEGVKKTMKNVLKKFAVCLFAMAMFVSVRAVFAADVSAKAADESTTYTITYKLNGGTLSESNPTTVSTTDDPFTLNSPTRKGYTFDGWYKKVSIFYNKVGPTFDPSRYSSDVTLYAQWTPITYTLKLSSEFDGTVESYTFSYNDTIKFSDYAPQRDGYTLAYWSTGKNGTGTRYSYKAYGLTETDGDTVTLYAYWVEKKYNIIYMLNGGTNNSANPDTYGIKSTATLSAPTRNGYVFGGWYSDSSLATAMTKLPNDTKYSDKAIYAKWTPQTYTITYYLNGGTNSSQNPTSYTTESPSLYFNDPTRTGYTFGGWYSDSAFKNSVPYIDSGSYGNKTLYAKWIANTYTIVFKGNGSTSGTMTSQKSLAYDKSYKLTKNKFKKKGYTFAGWNTKKNGKGTSYKNAASVKNLVTTNNGKITLYAQWKKKTK
jgi:uncharacterized repeat protein (TIGR02543 family)